MRIHPNAFRIIEGMSYKRARNTLKEFGCTKSEQSYIIREYKKLNQMTTILSIGLKFPFDHPDYEKRYEELYVFCKGVENFEKNFGIELSCGEGKFMSDFWQWTDSGEGLVCTVTDEELEKYDGNVDLSFPPRFSETKELLKKGKMYVFTIKVDNNDGFRYYLNSKEVKRDNCV